MILRNLVKTCADCPSQWEAVNEHGQPVYIRYRFGALTVHCPCNAHDEQMDYPTFQASEIFRLGDGSGWNGDMDEEEMLQLTGYSLAGKENEDVTRKEDC